MLVAISNLRLSIKFRACTQGLGQFYSYQSISSEHYLGTMASFCTALHRAGCEEVLRIPEALRGYWANRISAYGLVSLCWVLQAPKARSHPRLQAVKPLAAKIPVDLVKLEAKKF